MKFLRLFFFGIIAALSALFLELVIVTALGDSQEMLYTFFAQITPLLFAIVIVEEIFKFIFIYKSYSDLKSDFKKTTDTDAIIKKIFFSSIYIGLGFSFIEILVVSTSLSFDRNFSQFALPALGIMMVHIVTSATMGYLLAKSKFVDSILILKALLITASVHIFYNLLIIYSASPLYISLYLLSLISFFLIMFLKITPKRMG